MYRARDWTRHFLELRANHRTRRTHHSTAPAAWSRSGASSPRPPGHPDPRLRRASTCSPRSASTPTHWRRFDRGRQTDTGGHLHLRPRAMAKLGQLVLQRGVWDQGDIVSGAWIDAATAVQTRFSADQRPYGYLWWRAQARLRARDDRPHLRRRQRRPVHLHRPRLDLVVVFTGSNYNDPAAGRPFAILGEYILPAAHRAAAVAPTPGAAHAPRRRRPPAPPAAGRPRPADPRTAVCCDPSPGAPACIAAVRAAPCPSPSCFAACGRRTAAPTTPPRP
jgi:hypothetical protein